MKVLAGVILGLGLSSSAIAFDETNPTSLCVQNQSDVELFFVLSIGEDQRQTSTLKPDQQLCIAAQATDQPATVGVFESPFAMEGCSRLAKLGQTHILVAYSSFDNCTWLQEEAKPQASINRFF